MIKKAAITYPDILFRLCDVTSELDKLDSYDIIFSNACLQWIPNHEKFIPELMNKLNPGGVLAVQIPMNGQESLFKMICTSTFMWIVSIKPLFLDCFQMIKKAQ